VNDAGALFLLFLVGATAVYGGISAALLALLVAAIMYVLPTDLEKLQLPLFVLFLGIVGSALLPAIGSAVFTSILEGAVYVVNQIAGAIVAYGAVGGIAVAVALVLAYLVARALITNRAVRRYSRKYWTKAVKSVRGGNKNVWSGSHPHVDKIISKVRGMLK